MDRRCFLFLVNYARMKPEVALKALPTLEMVITSFLDIEGSS
jgi:AP-2 complex subunit beta-1